MGGDLQNLRESERISQKGFELEKPHLDSCPILTNGCYRRWALKVEVAIRNGGGRPPVDYQNQYWLWAVGLSRIGASSKINSFACGR